MDVETGKLLLRLIVSESPVVTTSVGPGDHAPLTGAGQLPPPRQKPHIGTDVPSGVVALILWAVRLNVAALTSLAAKNMVTNSAVARKNNMVDRIMLLLRSLLWPFLFSSHFTNGRAWRVDDQHHHHAAGKDVVRRDLALVMRVPHIGISCIRVLLG